MVEEGVARNERFLFAWEGEVTIVVLKWFKSKHFMYNSIRVPLSEHTA